MLHNAMKSYWTVKEQVIQRARVKQVAQVEEKTGYSQGRNDRRYSIFSEISVVFNTSLSLL